MLSRIFAILTFLLCFLSSPGASAGNRLALVIGINDYEAWPKLEKAIPDAQRAAKELEAQDLGFNAELLDSKEKTSRASILAAWQRLLRRIEHDDVVLFYFAGHGIELAGHNFLIASDNKYDTNDAEQVKAGALDFQAMLSELSMRQAETDAIAIFIIDACRENPFQGKNASTEVSAGLGPVRPPRQVFVMYSAGVGQKALDGGGQENSVYAEALWNVAKQRGLGLSELAQRLRRSVYLRARESWHMQTPAYYDQLRSARTLSGIPIEADGPDQVPANTFFPKAPKLSAKHTLIECDLCPELVVLPSGVAAVGAGVEENEAGTDERPQHRVEFPKRFAIGKFEVTNREWKYCFKDGGCDVAPTGMASRDSHPVTGISWEDARSYTDWLSSRTGHRYRLASEAEWEYATRAGTQTRYSFSADPVRKLTERQLLCLYANGADRTTGALLGANWACDDGIGREPAQVGSYLPNAFGLFDMHGNVWEWVEDCWHANYEGAPTDGSSWQTPGQTCTTRVARGGSWRSGPAALRSAVRHTFPASHRRATLGFRVVREIDEDE
jgi:formylglycine-generating enzyme required for sulfatase activity